MFKYYFERIQDIAIWPVISLIIFFVFFVGVVLYVFFVDKKFIDKMKNMPLEDDTTKKDS